MKHTKTLRTICFEDLKHDSHLIDYVDENIIILDSMDYSGIPLYETIKINSFMMAFCVEGELDIHVNDKVHALKADHCVILLPNTIIRHIPQKKQCILRIVAYPVDFLRNVMGVKKELWDIGRYLYANPVFPIRRDTSYKLYLYKELLMNCINEQPYAFLKEAKKHLFSAFFCEMMSRLYEDIPTDENALSYRADRSVYIFRKFMEKVNEDNGTHRSVAYYADLLCYSPKHLSTVVKKVSGKAPLSIINEHAMECIKWELKHSNLSMKEIADKFDFANPSFFGKFVKQHLGMSPQQYRNSTEG